VLVLHMADDYGTVGLQPEGIASYLFSPRKVPTMGGILLPNSVGQAKTDSVLLRTAFCTIGTKDVSQVASSKVTVTVDSRQYAVHSTQYTVERSPDRPVRAEILVPTPFARAEGQCWSCRYVVVGFYACSQ
jgi:hypothetical protein